MWLLGAFAAIAALAGAFALSRRGAVEAAGGGPHTGPGGEASPTVDDAQLSHLAHMALLMLLAPQDSAGQRVAAQHAVQAFQQGAGLPVTGVVDAATRAALQAAYPSWNGSGV